MNLFHGSASRYLLCAEHGQCTESRGGFALAVREMTVILGDKANIQETANNVRHYVIMPAISDYIHL